MTIHTGDCIEVMKGMEPDSIDAVVTDPPYGLEFMGKGWDKFGRDTGPGYQEKPRMNTGDGLGGYQTRPNFYTAGTPFQAWCEAWGRAALRVTKPGGYLLAFGGTRTHHRLVCGLEDAGWIIRDELDWIYASGFPKGKANLKPAHEPIVLARKPGPLRPLAIDACRIPSGEELIATHHGTGHGGPAAYISTGSEPYQPGDQRMEITAGRWPSNLLLSDPALFDEPNAEVVGSGAVSQATPPGTKRPGPRFNGGTYANGEIGGEQTEYGYGDTGGYSRFFRVPTPSDMRGMREADIASGHAGDNNSYPIAFLIPKADRGDREPVLRGQLTEAVVNITEGHGRGPVNTSKKSDDGIRINNPRENAHPTVKPTDLMRHLVRLVTPQGGTVLDCFLGSGSTAIAAELEGFAWIGIEKEAEYVAIAEARLNGTQKGLGLAI